MSNNLTASERLKSENDRPNISGFAIPMVLIAFAALCIAFSAIVGGGPMPFANGPYLAGP